jgi:hypothetical protein
MDKCFTAVFDPSDSANISGINLPMANASQRANGDSRHIFLLATHPGEGLLIEPQSRHLRWASGNWSSYPTAGVQTARRRRVSVLHSRLRLGSARPGIFTRCQRASFLRICVLFFMDYPFDNQSTLDFSAQTE